MPKKNPTRIYLDNAATSWPKPPAVVEAIRGFIETVGGNPGRSAHQSSLGADRVVYQTREAISKFFNGPDPLRVVFTANVTEAINLVLFGLLHPGDHVITSSLEHNAVMRPLRRLESLGVELTVIESPVNCFLDPDEIARHIRLNTKLIVMNHASNVTGSIMPVDEIGRIARNKHVLMMTDEAQSGGSIQVDMERDYIDLLAFTGHKSLMGPSGTGGLVLGSRVDHLLINPLKYGGTGSNSEKEQQPDFLPDRFESGTLNTCGLAGLAAGLAWIKATGLSQIRSHEMSLCQKLIDGLNQITGVKVYGGWNANVQTPVVSFTIKDMDNAKIGTILDEEYGIQCRVGLHCAPAAHKTIGTFPKGTVRLSIGFFNTDDEIEKTVRSIYKIKNKG